MSPAYLLGLSFTLLVVLSIATALYLSWRKRNALHTGLAQLLEDITEQQQVRKTRLSRTLLEKFDLVEADAVRLSEQLVAAEKKFLQHYLHQSLLQKPNEHLYVELCQLLDVYIDSPAKQIRSKSDAESDDRLIASEPQATQADKNAAHPEPDWGDVFD